MALRVYIYIVYLYSHTHTIWNSFERDSHVSDVDVSAKDARGQARRGCLGTLRLNTCFLPRNTVRDAVFGPTYGTFRCGLWRGRLAVLDSPNLQHIYIYII